MSCCIPILGYYGHNNAGDEAFKAAFSGTLGDVPHQFVTSLPQGGSTPVTLFGGGAILNEYFTKYLSSARSIYAVGCSFPYGDKDIHILDPLRDRLRCLLLRSRRDVAVARAAGYDATFTPDLVFSAKPVTDPGEGMTIDQLVSLAVLPPQGFSPDRRKLFVFLSGDYWLDYLTGNRKRFEEIELLKERLAKALDAMSARYDIVMPSMSVWYSARDYIFAGDVLKRMRRRERVCLIERYVDAPDLISVLARTDGIVLSMKYHGLVFGLLSGRFAVNVGTTRKTLDLMEDFGTPGLTFDSRKQTSDMLIETLSRAEEPALMQHIAMRSGEWKAEATARLRDVADMVREECRPIAA